MINIRYHIVSITAIFLALGIGTLLGSTFLDRATVDQLDRNIRNAEARIADTEARNSRLEQIEADAQERDDALIAASETLLDGQLTDQPVLLVVAPGVDQGVVDTLRQVLAGADADLRGSLTLRDELTFSEGVPGGLADQLGLDEDDPSGAREEVMTALVEALVAAGAPLEEPTDTPDGESPEPGTTTTAPADGSTTTAPADGATTTAPADGSTTTTPADGTTTTTEAPTTTDPDEDEDPSAPDGDQPEVLAALIDADLVRFDPGPAYTPDRPVLEQTGYRYVYVSHPDLEPEADALLLDLLPTTETDPPLPAVVVSATVPDPVDAAEEPAPTAVDLVREDRARSALYDTVDDVDTYLGLTSTITILRTEDGAAAGHYGQADSATALAPARR
jgi:hypothetical protein